ncbi:MAG: AraC family transcriptional regulator [Clostridiales bacterium]|nr:AraC family transcriptional regulator [Clostridiales bacterium]
MSIILDHQLREKIAHDASVFPISYFQDELALLPNQVGPLHWHPEFEIATAASGVLEYQVGQERITLEPGDSILVGGNMLHSIRQLSGDTPDPMPNIVFFGSLIAPETSTIYARYIQPIIDDHALPYVVFRHDRSEHVPVNTLIRDIYRLLREQPRCYEMAVQRHLSSIFEYLAMRFDDLPRTEATRVQLNTQVRVQQMLAFINDHYAEKVTLGDIAGAASISRSEAGRCFQAYMGCSPVDALIQHRLQKAHGMLHDTTRTLQEISHACGFNSVNYFSRQFRKHYGYAPSRANERLK